MHVYLFIIIVHYDGTHAYLFIIMVSVIYLFNIQYIYDSCFEKVLFIKNVFGER